MTEAGAAGAEAAGPGWASVAIANPYGSIKMRVTEQGIPVAVKVDAAELHRDPTQLAAEMLRLCQRAAARAGLAKRKQLEEAGMSAAGLAHTGLPTEADVARQEIVEEQDYDTEPQSWLRTV
ncbi:hypothetical protein OHB26_06795 [Nocardia sp. NBC_01503]|uniref:hypothetical protein n=1 Tax=Nocardia sp. NBC_01503 TaxID=2975997 RepID=UPI002E7BB737|nr:hypothetical protein [Nocardia sp. NBC_01503]WTL33918.1 hypothetical protein OHB26_06795 [Nocardia sp. NBC_01503]